MAEGSSDLVIGIGNPLRGDDGVGWWLAQRAQALRPAPEVLAVHQLTPELAETLAGVRRVLFVDAWQLPQGAASDESDRWQEAPKATLRALQPASPPHGGRAQAWTEAGAFSHVLDPMQLLAITALLHSRAPQAWQLLVPAYAMPHDEGFSTPLRRLLPRAEALLSRWCEGGQDSVSHA